MSYSFSITANTKEDAITQIRDRFDEIAVSQPTHAADKEAVIVAAHSFVSLLEDPKDGSDIYVNVSGSLSWHWDLSAPPKKFRSANVSITAGLRDKP